MVRDFKSVFVSLLPTTISRRKSTRALESIYFSFTLDWSFGAPSLAWSPQLCISNYWPESGKLAPPRLGLPSSRGHPLGVAAATEFLESILYGRASRAFKSLRYQFGLGSAEQEEFSPSIFYFAAGDDLPTKPDDYLKPPLLFDLYKFSLTNLGTPDPTSSEVTGALLEGSHLVLRREIDYRKANNTRVLQDFYLILPIARPDSSWGDVEDRLRFVADQLAFLSTLSHRIVIRARDGARLGLESSYIDQMIDIWHSILDDAQPLLRSLQRMVSSGRSARRIVFPSVQRVQLSLRAWRPALKASWSKFPSIPEEVRSEITSSSELLFSRTSRLTVRSVNNLGLLEDLPRENDISYRVIDRELKRPEVRGPMEAIALKAEKVRRKLHLRQQVVNEILTHEGWEEQDERDRYQRYLTTWLALLTSVAAFPIIIGHLDWASLHTALTQSPQPIRAVSLPVGDFAHRWGTGIALLAALLIVISLLIGFGVQLLIRSRRGVSGVRKEVSESWSTAESALELRPDVLARRDQEVCDKLRRAVEALQSVKSTRSMFTRQGEAFELRREAEHFAVTAELFGNRPVPLWLPESLLYLSGASVGSTRVKPVSNKELEMVLSQFQYDEAAIKKITSDGQPPTDSQLIDRDSQTPLWMANPIT